jgi:putative hemolysin
MELLIIFVLILINGIFSMSEIALVSARKARLESAAKKGDSNAKIALSIANEPNRFLSTVQIGITLIGILTGIFSGEKMTSDIKAFYGQFELFALTNILWR